MSGSDWYRFHPKCPECGKPVDLVGRGDESGRWSYRCKGSNRPDQAAALDGHFFTLSTEDLRAIQAPRAREVGFA